MSGQNKNLGENITEFDFKDPLTTERMQSWMSHTIGKIKHEQNLTCNDLLKITELLKILLKDEQYKVPHKSKKPSLPRHERLVCWYCIALETEKGMKKMQAKKEAANRFLISEKYVQTFCTRHRRDIENMIEKFGYEDISSGYRTHLAMFKNHREQHFTNS